MHDVAVLGAGPAGVAAALAASRAGLDTVVIDEGTDAGGQVWRPPFRGGSGLDGEGDALRAELRASRVDLRRSARLWHAESIAGGGFRLACIRDAGPFEVEARSLVVAAGAVERTLPFPGWTMPGVMGLAALTALAKGHGVLPGRRVVLAGSGPLLLLGAHLVLAAGGEVAAIVDVRGLRDWLATLRDMLANAAIAAKGIGWLAETARHRIPVHRRHAVAAVRRAAGGLVVEARPVDRAWRFRDGASLFVEADVLCVGHGLVPALEVVRLLGVTVEFEASSGTWRPRADALGRTGVAGLYVCGDGAGIRGARAAAESGIAAAAAVCSDAGRAPAEAPNMTRLRRRARFGQRMAALSRPEPGCTGWMNPDTVVCRCEGTTRGEVDAAIAAGAGTIGTLKSWTRAGMGPCGGRYCAPATAMLLSAALRQPLEAIAPDTPRSPLRPVPIHALAGGFDYGEIPFPSPSPL